MWKRGRKRKEGMQKVQKEREIRFVGRTVVAEGKQTHRFNKVIKGKDIWSD